MDDISKFKKLLNANIFVSRPANVINNNPVENMVVINSPNMNMRTYVCKEDKWKLINRLFSNYQTVSEICKEVNEINENKNKI